MPAVSVHEKKKPKWKIRLISVIRYNTFKFGIFAVVLGLILLMLSPVSGQYVNEPLSYQQNAQFPGHPAPVFSFIGLDNLLTNISFVMPSWAEINYTLYWISYTGTINNRISVYHLISDGTATNGTIITCRGVESPYEFQINMTSPTDRSFTAHINAVTNSLVPVQFNVYLMYPGYAILGSGGASLVAFITLASRDLAAGAFGKRDKS